jgi:GPH family glycoside/pentoside/hexuronide:cation symporter
MSEKIDNKSDGMKLPFKVKFFYGGVEGGITVVWGVFSFFFLFFLTDVVGIKPATAGTIMLIAGVWDAVTDPVAGIISDRTKSKWGRRRPYLIGFLVPFAISAWLLFTDFGLSPGWTVAYFIMANVLFYFVQDFIAVPGNSLAAEMTRDYDERTTLVSWRTVWSSLFTLIGMVAPLLLVETFSDIFGEERWGWSAMMATLAVVGTIPILLAWNFTRGYERHPEKPVRVSFKDLREMLLENKPFLNLVGVIVSIIGSIGTLTVAVIYFLEHYMGYSEDDSAIVFLVFQATGILFVPVVNWIIQRYGKKTSTIIGGALAALVYSSYFFIVPGQDVLVYAMFIAASLAVNFMYMVYWSMIPDVTEVDEFKSGQRREGIYFAVTDFINKVVMSLGAFLVGLLLDATGYIPDAPPESSITMIRVLTSFAPAAFALLLIVFGILSPMTKTKHEALKKAIELKKAGQEFDAESIEGIV